MDSPKTDIFFHTSFKMKTYFVFDVEICGNFLKAKDENKILAIFLLEK